MVRKRWLVLEDKLKKYYTDEFIIICDGEFIIFLFKYWINIQIVDIFDSDNLEYIIYSGAGINYFENYDKLTETFNKYCTVPIHNILPCLLDNFTININKGQLDNQSKINLRKISNIIPKFEDIFFNKLNKIIYEDDQ